MNTKQQEKHVQWKLQKILSLENTGSYELKPRAEVRQPVTVPPKLLAGPSGGRQPPPGVVSEVLSPPRQILRLGPRCCFLLSKCCLTKAGEPLDPGFPGGGSWVLSCHSSLLSPSLRHRELQPPADNLCLISTSVANGPHFLSWPGQWQLPPLTPSFPEAKLGPF